MVRIGTSDLDVFALALGGNVFGWTADRESSFAVLDAYVEAGGDFIDTADCYSAWMPGNSGGESETIIGQWLRSRGHRSRLVIATKVGAHPKFKGLSPQGIRGAIEQSLRRLQTDYIDLYYTHFDQPEIPVEEFLGVLDELIREGKVRHIGASNISVERLAEALNASERDGLAKYVVLQQHYNLMERGLYEGPLAAVVAAHGLSSAPYYALASGFLTGKYRPGTPLDGPRAQEVAPYLEAPRGARVLAVLDRVAQAHGTDAGAVALAWLAAQPTVATPIASARSVSQLSGLLAFTGLILDESELRLLSAASA